VGLVFCLLREFNKHVWWLWGGSKLDGDLLSGGARQRNVLWRHKAVRDFETFLDLSLSKGPGNKICLLF
jgi:hypothetical protein